MIPPKAIELEEDGKIVGVEDSFTAKIYVGCLDTEQGFERPVAEVKAYCQDYVEDEGLCVNVQDTFYQYGSGGSGNNERGAIVELIHYPRFPKDDPEKEITELALDLGERLMKRMNQKRISVVTSTNTYTLQNPNHGSVE